MVFAFIVLSNCEKDVATIQPKEDISSNDPITEPKIENFSLKDLSTDYTFNDLSSTYGILQPRFNTKTKSRSIDNILDSLNITIDPSTIKKISSQGYVSYTMLMIEPDDKSNDFSNLVIQEKDGIKRIFTIRYKQKVSVKTKTGSSTSSSAYSYDDIDMQSGISTHDMWYDDSDDGGNGGGGSNGCEEFTTVCNTVDIWVPHGCTCRGHMPWENCSCPLEGGEGPYYTWESSNECEDVCVAENYPDPPNDNTDNGWTSGPGTSSTGDNSNPT